MRAFAARDANEYEQAETLHAESLVLRRALDDHQGIAASISNLGDVAQLRGDREQADALHSASLSRFREVGDKSGIAYALCKMGVLALQRGEIARANALHRESLHLSWELRDKRRIAESLEQIAGVRAAREENEAAARLLAASDALRAQIGAPLPPDEQADFDRSVADTRAAGRARLFPRVGTGPNDALEGGRRRRTRNAAGRASRSDVAEQ
jgi:tetratricopeptide (TPR) repeat protein